jgi:UPF0176 protein
MFRRFFIQTSNSSKFSRISTTTVLLHQQHTISRRILPSIMTITKNIPASNSFSTTSALERGFQPVSKIEDYDSSTYKTLAFYKFHQFTKPELDELRTQLLTDFGELGIVGRIYISTEGLNAQIACPEECLGKLQAYHDAVLKPMFGDNLMDLNIGTEHGKRSFRALHVRIRKQVK